MSRKRLTVVPKNCPATHMSTHGDVNVLCHRGEPPYGETMTKQIDAVSGLNCPSSRSRPNIRGQQGSPQCCYDGRPQDDVPEVVMLWSAVSTYDVRTLLVILHRSVEEMQTDAVASVPASLLGVEVVECAPIVLIDVAVLDEHRLGGVRNLSLETLSNGGRFELRVQHLRQEVVTSPRDIDPVVGCQYLSALSAAMSQE